MGVNPLFWKDVPVLITGHTGFKGAWLSVWLHELGAQVYGIALAPDSRPNMFELLNVGALTTSNFCDINEKNRLSELLASICPKIVFHLAAQSLVRPSYDSPVETFMTNAVGTVSLLQAVRTIPSVEAIIVVTSDKCYENREWVWGYRETDRLGGSDPYSGSKGCAEIATWSMQKSFFSPYAFDGHPARIATARSGNVIGGGDWSQDRLIPDIVRGCLGSSREVYLRYPEAVRPWQHVLEPLGGYLLLAERLVLNPEGIDEAWNFGPSSICDRTVLQVSESVIESFGIGKIVIDNNTTQLKETSILRLNCEKATTVLDWVPLLTFEEAIQLTTEWYMGWANDRDMMVITRKQINDFSHRAPYIVDNHTID